MSEHDSNGERVETDGPKGTGYLRLEDVQMLVTDRHLRLAFFVTALPLELSAVRAHMTNLGGVRAHDGTILECGRFSDRGQEWLVVVGETGAGTHNAQQVVSTGHITFSSLGKFELMIFVGIGGSRKKGAGIGSVVAADKVYYPYGGKYTGGALANRPTSVLMDHELVNIARKIIRDETWPARILAFRKGPAPGDEAYPVPMPPDAKVAPIASIEAVLDDPTSPLEELLKTSYGDTHVVEMEGYGAVFIAHTERTPGMIVRGVSDMTNQKSDDDDEIYQPIAASHAAAFAFEMLIHWGMHNGLPQSASRLAPAPNGARAEKTTPRTDAIGLKSADISNPLWAAADRSVVLDVRPLDEVQYATTKFEISVVLNITADFGTDDQKRLDRLQKTLRELSGSQQIEIVEARAGSLVLFVADPDSALVRFGERRLRKGLSEVENVELIGMMPIKAYEVRQNYLAEFDSTSAELLSWRTTLPDGERLERPELETLSTRIDSNVRSTTALIGPPGAGKSALLATLGKNFHAAGWPVLALKADLLDPDIASERDLRERLGLSADPSVMVRDLAAFGPVLLIIDQLDALAGYLDIKTARLSILLNLVRRLGNVNNVHVVLSSRIFEFQHDVRLRAVDAESIMLELPPWSEVLPVLEARGVAAAGWPADAQEVMRSPQALATYLQLSIRDTSVPFASYQLMLDRLWEERVLTSGDAGERDRLASDIAETMAEQESLWIATARFADRPVVMQALIAAGILVTLHTSIGFSHQTLFDFTLARSFAREPGRLSTFATERQDSLFLRPKLWAGLTYLRGADRDLYHRELETIWRTPALRVHLRILIVDFLGSQLDPSDREALVMETALDSQRTRLRAFKSLAGSQGWFDRLANGRIASAMRSDQAVSNAQVEILARAFPSAPDMVVRLIRENWLSDPGNDSRSWSVIQWLPHLTDECLFVALTIIGRTDMSSSMIDHIAGSIAVEQPVAALRLMRARLDRDLANAVAESEARHSAASLIDNSSEVERIAFQIAELRDPLRNLIENSNEWDSLPGIAEKWPQATLDVIFPWFTSALEALDRLTERSYLLGYPLRVEADFRFESEDNLELPESSILAALRISVEGLAAADTSAFRTWMAQSETIALTPIQRLIAHGIAHRPQEYAQDGFDFVLADDRRYFLGSYRDLRGTIKRMVAAVSPYWTLEQVAMFEERVRSFSPPPPADEKDPKKRMSWRHSMRRTQLDILRSLPVRQRSAEVARQITEEERRYGQERASVSFSSVRTIGSVLEADAMAKARDDDIINAFVGLPDVTGWDNPKNWATGGNVQLARAFATFAKDHVERAIGILSRLDSANGTRAAAYTIETLSEAGAPATVSELVRNVVGRGFDSEEFRHSVARGLERMAQRGVQIDDDLVALLEHWVGHSPVAGEGDIHEGNAEQDEDARDASNDDSGVGLVERSLLWSYGGIRAVPGGNVPVADAIVRIRLSRGQADQAVAFLSTYLDQEKSIEAWDIMARHFYYLGAADPRRREALLERVFVEVRGVVGSMLFAQFFAWAQQKDHALIERHIDAWRDDTSSSTRQAYGEIVALDALTRPQHSSSVSRLEKIMHEPAATHERAGASLSAAHVFSEDSERRNGAAALLVRGLESQDPSAWTAVLEVFRQIEVLQPDEATHVLLRAVANGLSQSPELDATFIADRLATLLPHEAPLVGEIALGLVTKWEAELGDMRTATAMAASALVDLAITLHRLGPETRETGLQLFEQLIDVDAYGARRTLDEIDNRFHSTAPAARRRVRRRSEVSPRRRRRLP